MKNRACSQQVLAWVAVVGLLLPLGACASVLPDPLAGSLITSTAFSPDGMTIAAGYSQGQGCAVLIWHVRSPTSPPRILGCDAPEVDAVAFSPDGAFLAAASSEQAA